MILANVGFRNDGAERIAATVPDRFENLFRYPATPDIVAFLSVALAGCFNECRHSDILLIEIHGVDGNEAIAIFRVMRVARQLRDQIGAFNGPQIALRA
jgi:hypothetical protein